MWWMRYLLNLCDEVYVMNAIFFTSMWSSIYVINVIIVKSVWWSVCDELSPSCARSRGVTDVAHQSLQVQFLLMKGSLSHVRALGMTPEASSRTKEVFNSGEGASVMPRTLAWLLRPQSFQQSRQGSFQLRNGGLSRARSLGMTPFVFTLHTALFIVQSISHRVVMTSNTSLFILQSIEICLACTTIRKNVWNKTLSVENRGKLYWIHVMRQNLLVTNCIRISIEQVSETS
jgi:hypothetical protein